MSDPFLSSECLGAGEKEHVDGRNELLSKVVSSTASHSVAPRSHGHKERGSTHIQQSWGAVQRGLLLIPKWEEKEP